eukprot:5850831-Pyramimonas_sp.AAC.1
MYEVCNDASSLKDWLTPKTPYNLKRPDPPPAQEVEFSAVLMVRGACRAGAPAGGSDGSWMQAQNADVPGITSSGIAPSLAPCVHDPWRAHVQQLP